MDGGRKEQRWKKNEIPVCSYARRYITDIIEVCGRNVEEGGAEKWKTSSSGIPAYWPRCFLPHFSKFSLCPPFDSATSNNAALSTIPEGFSSILCIYTIPPPFEDQASCQLYTSARFSISRRGNRGMKLKKKKAVYQLLDDTGRVDVGGFCCFALHRSRFPKLNRGGSL